MFPGLRAFVEVFRGRTTSSTYGEVVSWLEEAFDRPEVEDMSLGDFALLGSAREVFLALHSIGFLGINFDDEQGFRFSHDGAPSELEEVSFAAKVAVHPCYWRALDLQTSNEPVDVLVEAFDEYEPSEKKEAVKDRRMQQLGKVVEELPRLQEGTADASRFEDWVQRAVKILFTGSLTNIELRPNGDAVARRDVVATNVAEKGFWRRVYEDYGARQVVFEVKNYSEIRPEDFRQARCYGGSEYGRIVFIVSRSQCEGASGRERAQILEAHKSGHLVVLLPATVLSRCIRKLRGSAGSKYWDEALTKKLDTHLRSYCSVSAGRSRRGKKVARAGVHG